MSSSVFSHKLGYIAQWVKSPDYQIYYHLIVNEEDAQFEAYYPFDYYEGVLSPEETVAIFGENCTSKLKLHTAFEALDPDDPEMLLRWVKTFGVPFTSYFRPDGIIRNKKNFPISTEVKDNTWTKEWQVQAWTSLKQFSNEVRMFKYIITLWDAINTRNWDVLIENKRQNYSWENIMNLEIDETEPSARPDFLEDMHEAWWRQKEETELADETESRERRSLLTNAIYNIESGINRGLLGTRPMLSFLSLDAKTNELKYTLSPKWRWEFTSLLSAIYLMLFLDISKGLKLRRCQKEKCQRLFAPSKESQTHCSPECQKSNKQKRYRDKIAACHQQI